MSLTFNHSEKCFLKVLFGLIVVITILFGPACAFGQIEIDSKQQKAADSLKRKGIMPANHFHHKNFGNAALDFGLAEILPWIFDRYVADKDYARISWKTIGHNLNPGSWEFDNDEFQTNQFGHPYHGSNFYSAFRVNGYTFWQAAPAAFAGSYLWETFAENQAPAPNDFINTSYGGIILGEMTYRLSNKIVNNRTRGFKRQVNEVFGFLINPMNGLKRITSGKWGTVPNNPADIDSSKIHAEFGLGARTFNTGSHDKHTGWYGHIKLLYGIPEENYRTPFSNIAVNAEFGKDDSTRINTLTVYGSLAGWEVGSTEKYEHLVILSANYDYIRNVSFFYSAQSLRINLLSEHDISKKVTINTSIGVGALILGAVPDKYLFRGRNYDYGSGAAINLTGGVNVANKLNYTINYKGGWLVTLSGSASHYFLHTLTTELSYNILRNLAITAEPGYLTLNGYYKHFDNVNSRYPFFRSSLRYSIDFD
jgi:hypothetical protein